MAFPASPTDGQIFNNYIYSNSVQAWKYKDYNEIDNAGLLYNSSGNAFNFDGGGTGITLDHNGLLDFGTGDFTIALYVKGDSDSRDQEVINTMPSFSNGPGFFFARANSPADMYFGLGDGSNGEWNNMGETGLFSWTHFIFMRQNSTLYVYKDGSLFNEDASFGYNITSSSALRIGVDAGGSRKFNGSIKNLMIFSRAVTEEERTQLRNWDNGFFT